MVLSFPFMVWKVPDIPSFVVFDLNFCFLLLGLALAKLETASFGTL